jgi:hypothetical protein
MLSTQQSGMVGLSAKPDILSSRAAIHQGGADSGSESADKEDAAMGELSLVL